MWFFSKLFGRDNSIGMEWAIEKTTVVRRGYKAGDSSVILMDAGKSKIALIKEIRDITGLGLKDSKALVDNGWEIISNICLAEAEELRDSFSSFWATVEVR